MGPPRVRNDIVWASSPRQQLGCAMPLAHPNKEHRFFYSLKKRQRLALRSIFFDFSTIAADCLRYIVCIPEKEKTTLMWLVRALTDSCNIATDFLQDSSPKQRTNYATLLPPNQDAQ